jgi:hypothetical protein
MMVQVQTLIGPMTVRARHLEIEGIPCALHPTISEIHSHDKGQDKGLFTVTDVASGLAIVAKCETRDQAVGKAQALLRGKSKADLAKARRRALRKQRQYWSV